MRKLILMMQVSLDGFVEGPNGDMSWIATDDNEQWQDVFQMFSSVDLCLLGRVMWPDYRDYWKQALTNPAASANEVKYAKLAEKTKHLVFSNTITDAGWENAEVVKGDAAKQIAKIKQQPGKDIYVVGGAKLAASVIEAGLVDEYRLTINPLILGSGKSFFKDQHTLRSLELIDVKDGGGRIVVRYKSK